MSYIENKSWDKMKKYRIVKDNWSGFEVQVWRLWFPFWVQARGTNTHPSIEQARAYIDRGCKEVKVNNVIEEYDPKDKTVKFSNRR